MSANDNPIPISVQIRKYLKAVNAHVKLSDQLIAFLKSI